MLENDSRSLVAGVAALVLVLLLTLPSLIGVASHLRDPKPKSNVYEDKDGVASEKSVAKYSAKIPKLSLGFFTISGLSLSIALAVLGMVGESDGLLIEDWINVAQWVSSRDSRRSLLTFLGTYCSSNR